MDIGGGQERDETQDWDKSQSSGQRWDRVHGTLVALKAEIHKHP